jgi:hypothetical protein
VRCPLHQSLERRPEGEDPAAAVSALEQERSDEKDELREKFRIIKTVLEQVGRQWAGNSTLCRTGAQGRQGDNKGRGR